MNTGAVTRRQRARRKQTQNVNKSMIPPNTLEHAFCTRMGTVYIPGMFLRMVFYLNCGKIHNSVSMGNGIFDRSEKNKTNKTNKKCDSYHVFFFYALYVRLYEYESVDSMCSQVCFFLYLNRGTMRAPVAIAMSSSSTPPTQRTAGSWFCSRRWLASSSKPHWQITWQEKKKKVRAG